MRRTQAAGDDAEIRPQRLGEHRLELLRIVPDDRDPRRLEPEADQLAREKGTVAVGAVAADELTARDDDETMQTGRRAA